MNCVDRCIKVSLGLSEQAISTHESLKIQCAALEAERNSLLSVYKDLIKLLEKNT